MYYSFHVLHLIPCKDSIIISHNETFYVIFTLRMSFLYNKPKKISNFATSKQQSNGSWEDKRAPLPTAGITLTEPDRKSVL